MAIDNVQEYIKNKLKEIEKFNRRIERINDVLEAGEEEKEVKGKTKRIPLTANRVKELNVKIDLAIKEIEDIQAQIEIELVNRSLDKDDKAKKFIEDRKNDLKDKIDNNKKEIEDLENFEVKKEENKKIEEVNKLIEERKILNEEINKINTQKEQAEKKIQSLEKDIANLENLEKENESLFKEITNLEKKLNDPNLSQEEKESIQEELKEKEEKMQFNNGRMFNSDIVIQQKRNQLEEQKNIIEKNDQLVKVKIARISAVENNLNELGITDLDDFKLETILNENKLKIDENVKIINNVKNNLKIEPERENDADYIKQRVEEEIEKRKQEISKLQEKESNFDENNLKKEIKDNIKSQYGGKDSDRIENIIDSVVKARKQKAIEERKAKKNENEVGQNGNGAGVPARTVGTTLPILSKLKEPERNFGEKVGFFQNLKERWAFRKKRKEFAKEMYPELNEVELENYIDDNIKDLNYLIRTGATIKDVKEGVKIQQEIRKERLEKIKNNSFLEKLKVELEKGDKADIDQVIAEHSNEKAKEAIDKDDDR